MTDKKKKKAAQGEDDDETGKLLKKYRARCEANGVSLSREKKNEKSNEPPPPTFWEKLQAAVDEGEDIEKLHLWDPQLGPVGTRAMMEAMLEIPYKHLKSLRLWKVNAQDEGVRTICNYMKKSQAMEYLDLLDNQIGLLGCEFLGKALHPTENVPLLKLKLDHNPFGTAGLQLLCKGLSNNNTLEKLSLCYCDIDADGSKYFQEILSNVETKLQKLKIQGNLLKNEGIFELFRGLKINDVLNKLNIADNQFNLEDKESAPGLIKLIIEVMKNNNSLIFYNLKYNGMSDEDGYQIIECIEQNKNICKVELSDHLSQTVLEKIKSLTKKRKPKKKGKGKKGKKKK